jgi:hypothetical protein
MFRRLLKLGMALGLAVMMAEVPQAVQKVSAAGAEPTVISGLSAADTQLIPNDGHTVLRVINGGAEPTEVTITTPGTETGGVGIEDRKVTVANTKTKIIGPFPRSLYGNTLEVKLTKVTSVTLEIVSVEST